MELPKTRRIFWVKGSHYYDIPNENEPFIQENNMRIIFPQGFTNEEVKKYLDDLARKNNFYDLQWQESTLHGLVSKDYCLYCGSIDYIKNKEEENLILEKSVK